MGRRLMAVLVLMCLVCYLRPKEGLGLLRQDLVPPAPGVNKQWSLLVCPEERPDRTKVGDWDDSIAVDCQWLPKLGSILE